MQLDIDIAALNEVRFAEQGSLTEDGAGNTLFRSGKNKDKSRLSGVGFMIEKKKKKFHCQKIAELACWSFRPYNIRYVMLLC